ncbi:MAG TPA: glycosyltransferase family 2 protein [Pirellulaceae bacterium]|nr:glycosyltransferase family 2 protein [Planctomycetales bacterium]MCB9941358.1 glycosyltransferase family 2 protein [Planctomycetaceae bacterium]HRX79837.1 glycosyltransferase family 2 protein [Pirellulaceae bacterium]
MNSLPQRKPITQCTISIVLPVYNEVAVLRALRSQVIDALAPTCCQVELVFVNDGSTDGSAELLDQLAREDSQVHVLHLSRNFGHQAALHAGLTHATGDAIIVMDSDMQDAPSCLVEFVDRWQQGFDVVYAVREKRKEGLIKRGLFFGFYRVLRMLATTDMPRDAGNFGLIDRRVLDNILKMGEYDRYYAGLRSWVGFRQTGVVVERLARHDSQPRVSFLGLCSLAKTALFSFSSAPLGLFYAIAAVSLFVFTAFTGFTLYHKCITGLAIPGWTSSIMIASFFGALNALGISVLGEYVVRIYDQVRARPKFIVSRHVNYALQDDSDADLEEELAETLANVESMRSIVVLSPSADNFAPQPIGS